MPLYEFEIQSLIKLKIRMGTIEEARRALVECPSLFKDRLVGNCTISDGNPVHDNLDDDTCDCESCTRKEIQRVNKG